MKKVLACLFAAIMAVALVSCNNSDDTTSGTGSDGSLSGSVSTDGSTSMESVIGALGEAFTKTNPNVKFTYNPTGSSSGITAVSEGRCDIGLSSRALKDEEKANLTGTTLALDGIAIIVNNNNTVSDLTVEQIAKIYTGEITNWNQVGGKDGEIVLIGREAGSGTRDGFESITGTEKKMQISSGTYVNRRRYNNGITEPECNRLCFAVSCKQQN